MGNHVRLPLLFPCTIYNLVHKMRMTLIVLMKHCTVVHRPCVSCAETVLYILCLCDIYGACVTYILLLLHCALGDPRLTFDTLCRIQI